MFAFIFMTDPNHYNKTKEFFNQSALNNQGYYDGTSGRLMHNRWQGMIRRIVIKKIGQMLAIDQDLKSLIDVGCGNGDFCLELKKRFSRLTEIYGCDYSEDMLAILRQSVLPSDNIFAQQADLLTLPFANNHFDVALCINTLHHIHEADLAKAVAELARVSRRYVIVEIKNKQNFYKRLFHMVRNNDKAINVYPTDPAQIKLLFHCNGYHLWGQKNIFGYQFLSPLIVQIYCKTKID